ncbi:predicted protein [Sclerotinia sclerotiorum 1980 UF-70]|uniref:SAP domain-containing protein n=2 Tax=Sclerotinia sclerotiorum (strain ATCC 18683 / 1980 / Ss-1) TaxID=665079 RepID=A7E8M2_SCLS1|nr:predicted protein [Sclerotinia sclerotiorum 1980 UF-70]APA05945.1 hypothetical protein sscle_01g007150 [Sclerotinia sclerotiorum 1980 UF-70]EDN96724.1 predicted protein [Sclerotinia sclerotiorum 1980 UF-70]
MKTTKARASKKRKGHPSSSTTSQSSISEEVSPALTENAPKKKGRPSKNAVAIATKGKEVDDRAEWVNIQPTMLTRSWTRSGKVSRATELHREKADPEDNIGTEGELVAEEDSGPRVEERPSKRQKQNMTTQDNGESSSNPRLIDLTVQTPAIPEKTTAEVNKVKTPKPPKIIKPKKPKKIKPPKGKWRAYCAFRGLDTTGTREDMWERLRDHFRLSGVEYVAGIPEYETRVESELVREIIEREEGNSYDVSGGDVWVFQTRPKLSAEEWIEFFGQYKYRSLGLVFTTPPQFAYSNDDESAFKYQRGTMEGIPYYNLYSGGTWVGTGFAKGTILGRTPLLVKQKVEEICEQVRKTFIGRYIMNERNADEQHVDPAQLPVAKTWTAEEEQRAQVLWNLDDSTKRPSDVSYQFGKIVEESFLASQLLSPPASSTLARFVDRARFIYVDENVCDGGRGDIYVV